MQAAKPIPTWITLVVCACLTLLSYSAYTREKAADAIQDWIRRQSGPISFNNKIGNIRMSTIYSATGSFDSDGVTISVTVQVHQREGETGTQAVARLHQKRADAEEEHGPIQWQ